MDISFIRGNVLQFSTTFYSAAGDVVTPASVLLTLRVAVFSGSPADGTQIAMTQIGDAWTATWDTTGMESGTVYWNVQATGPHAADEGSFPLTANWANGVT